MSDFSLAELHEAKAALSSTLHKSEAINLSRLSKSQQSLLERRIRALRLALVLIDEELGEKPGHENDVQI